ncbi:ATP-binding protein [Aeromicrobium sp. IC_218]|uniref:ATP-binding protein n=1 Tax=Aeromicrobium sp. IC_218 TaxID=2545468 RepID=UPI001F603B84|nr:ATP-binding protein [Aeromicrobium sp. IC_218]
METTVRRGRLIVYLGAAPGVGKTFAMLDEARRRLDRGTDVVVGFVETHGRTHTAAKLEGLEVVPRKVVRHGGAEFTEMDTEAIIARRPAVVCVDELAHTNVPGSVHPKRVDDVEQIRSAGIDVITTINVQHLESLNDAVERITGVRQRETVPDPVVRQADQIQLVDMSPEALRRRLAHGNVYRPEQVDASLSSYFRVGNLTALRELALLWLADRVDDALDDYRRAHHIDSPWPAKERIVVAVTGGPESESLLRRGARLAQRSAAGELLAVHVIVEDGLAGQDSARIARLQQLTASLGATFHSVVGEEPASAVVDFAVGANATMIVVGTSSHGRLRRLFTGTTGERVASLAGSVDVHLVTHDERPRLAGRRRRPSSLDRRRRVAGLVLGMLLPVVLTLALRGVEHSSEQLPLDVLLFLGATVLVALVGGLLPSLVAALSGFVLLNWFFTPPVRKLTVSEPTNVLALVVFVAVAVGVASVVDRASRRAADAVRARTEAATMTALSRSVLTGQDTAEAVVERVRETFGQESASLLARAGGSWRVVAGTGGRPPRCPEDGETTVDVDAEHAIVLHGSPLRAGDRRVLEAFAVQTSLVLEYRRLRERGDRAAALERAEATSTALLRAVSHDLRTPLAITRAAVDGLVSDALAPDERAELVAAVAESTGRLEQLIDDLLDLSRVESGSLRPVLRPRSLEEVLPVAVSGHAPGAVELVLDESVPFVRTDGGLLTRVVANLVANAVRHGRGAPVRVTAHVLADTVEVHVVDRGPGVPADVREQMFEPFQRLDDTGGEGLGLGLAVARGLTDALDGTLTAEDTPGGGLTMVLALPRAGRDEEDA